MTTAGKINGRFCNYFIRNICVSILAEKYDLEVSYLFKDEVESLGVTLYSGKNKYEAALPLTDGNYMFFLNESVNLKTNFSLAINTYFQTNIISRMLHDYLRSDLIRNKIMLANKFQHRYNNNTDIFIHVRLGDVPDFNPGILYYDKIIQRLLLKNPNNLFISSDTIDHPLCKLLLNKYKGSISIQYDYIDTLMFASTCKYIVLSHGSFSATIGNLGFFSEIYYPKYFILPMWHGDMFTIPGWNMISF